MLDQYSSFFVASSGSAAAFIGLLFVALTIANQGQPDREVVTRRESLAASAFALLLAAFVVALVGLAGDVDGFAAAMIVMACFGLLVTGRHLPRAIRAGNWARGSSARTMNIALPMTSIPSYLAAVELAIWLLVDAGSGDALRASVLIALAFYGGALGRAWEITKT